MRVLPFLFVLSVIFWSAEISEAATNHPKILIIYDMEGVSGVSHL